MFPAPMGLKARGPPLTSRPFHAGTSVKARPAARPRLSRAAAQTVTRAAKQAYICIDCGYIYDGSAAFETLPNSYKCPACNSPKRRFKEYAGAGRNDEKSMQSRMKGLKAGGSSGGSVGVDSGDKSLLGVIAVGGAAALGALYLYLNASF